MLFGALLLILGVLIAVYPPLLSLIVALLLISLGGVFIMIGYRMKKLKKRYDNPFVDFFIRF